VGDNIQTLQKMIEYLKWNNVLSAINC
jgi:hypothetical protein